MPSCHMRKPICSLTKFKGRKSYPRFRRQVNKLVVMLSLSLLSTWRDLQFFQMASLLNGVTKLAQGNDLGAEPGIQPEDWLELAGSNKCPFGLAFSTPLWGKHLENMSNSVSAPLSWGSRQQGCSGYSYPLSSCKALSQHSVGVGEDTQFSGVLYYQLPM